MIPSAGIIARENEEITALGLVGAEHELFRLSFWNIQVPDGHISSLKDDNLIGYIILKRDAGEWQRRAIDKWHIFEAVFKKYSHPHNCLPNAGVYPVTVAGKKFSIRGVLYCQQNGLNKACAHVAIRSLLSRLVPEDDISYASLNLLAQAASGVDSTYQPSNGLTVQQIRHIFHEYHVNFRDIDYDESCKLDSGIRKNKLLRILSRVFGSKQGSNIRESQPYQRYLYSGIESGLGGLLGFSMDGPKATKERHIIPFFGHTFNKDTWVPDADASYFNIGAGVGFIPSENWTSSFLGHDDNFGPNFCIPRLYVTPGNVQYVVELLRKDALFNGMSAEAIALQLLYSLIPNLNTGNVWQARLKQNINSQKIVLRASCVSQSTYIAHLHKIADWNGLTEAPDLLSAIEGLLPDLLWVVEFSIPQLFPANERKLGEIVLNAHCHPENEFKPFIMARLPGNYLLSADEKIQSYERWFSQLQSHVELMRQND